MGAEVTPRQNTFMTGQIISNEWTTYSSLFAGNWEYAAVKIPEGEY